MDYEQYENDIKQFEKERAGQKEYNFKELSEDIQNKVFNILKNDVENTIFNNNHKHQKDNNINISRQDIINYLNENFKFYENGDVAFEYSEPDLSYWE